jgi:hypothetical protein
MLIIPNMNMPTSCLICPCFSLYDGRAYCRAKENIRHEPFEMNPDFAHGGRQEWCPLIEKKPGVRILKEKAAQS